MKKLFTALFSRYTSYWVILIVDTLISVLCTLFAYVVLVYLYGTQPVVGIMLRISIFSVIATLPAQYISKTYRHIIRHSTLQNLWNVLIAVIIKEVVMLAILFFSNFGSLTSNFIFQLIAIDGALTVITMILARMAIITLYNIISSGSKGKLRCLIYGDGKNSVALQKSLIENNSYSIIGFLSSGKKYHNYVLSGLSVFSFSDEQDFEKLIRKKHIGAIIFPDTQSVHEEKKRLIMFCKEHNIKTLIYAPIDEAEKGSRLKKTIRNISIEDLLGREEIIINLEKIKSIFDNKSILITGAAGSIGSEIVRQTAELGVKKLILFDIAETPLHDLRLEIEKEYPDLDFVPIIGDVRVEERLNVVFKRYSPDIVFHAAAYKHVPLMEENPCEAISVNTIGTKMVADAAIKYGADIMIMISTDKAVNPTNIMGATKRLAEIYVQSLGTAIKNGKTSGRTKFITTRFGNVLGSNGSVIPLFKKQIESGGPVTVTHPEIIRYFMTIPEACRLVLEAATLGNGNDIFVFDMGEPVKIKDMAEQMIELAGFKLDKDIEIKYTGLRPGEKLFEELLMTGENITDTPHKKIKIAKVREYDYDTVTAGIQELGTLSKHVKIEETVMLMKKIVPEFKSMNSQFEKFDITNCHVRL